MTTSHPPAFRKPREGFLIRRPAGLFWPILPMLFFASAAIADPVPPTPASLAPGYRPLPFRVPEPGSYRLPSLGTAADGPVLNTNHRLVRLHDLYGDKIVLLSFIYSTCDDVNGCPLATAVFHKIKNRLKKTPEVASRLRLITLSFNPEHDTPEVMRRYGVGLQDTALDWRFLTTRSEAELQPILNGYQQAMEKERDERGRFTGRFAHLLRVFLIDREKRIRNVYTVSFLHPDLVLADVETLLREPSVTVAEPVDKPPRPAARSGEYANPTLTEQHRGPIDLFGRIQQPVLGLPKLPVPEENSLTPEKIELGRKLFFDRRLSRNDTISCAMCHIPEQGFTSREQATAVGIEGRTVRRNAPTIYNVAFFARLFHDGREFSLENQVWGPLLAANEMGNPSVGFVLKKIEGMADYQGWFEKAFQRGPTMETLGQAIASYERALISGDSPFDRWRYGGEKDALSPAAKHGFELFTGKAGCSGCHLVGDQHALFTDDQMHNTGVGYRESMRKEPARQRIEFAPGIVYELDPGTIAQVAEPRPNDLGRYEITQNPADRWHYRTPTLRNIDLTAPYMHDGSFRTLREVVEFYDRGGEPNENLDPRIRPLGLSNPEIDALVEFLRALTGADIETLVADALAAPVGNSQ